jgi:hypothetical protein
VPCRLVGRFATIGAGGGFVRTQFRILLNGFFHFVIGQILLVAKRLGLNISNGNSVFGKKRRRGTGRTSRHPPVSLWRSYSSWSPLSLSRSLSSSLSLSLSFSSLSPAWQVASAWLVSAQEP